MNITTQVVAAALATLQPTPQEGHLTLEQALAIAERNAFVIHLSRSDAEKSRQRIAEARANLGPKVTVNGTYTRFDEAQTSSFGDQTFVTQPIDSKQVSAGLSMPIDISGNLNRLVRAARLQYEASKHTVRATINDVRFNTKAAYFNVLRAEGLVQVARQGVADAEERLRQARLLFDQQQIARVDVTRFETELAQAQAQLIAAQNSLQLAQNQFNFTIARPIETPVELAPITALPPIPAGDQPLVDAAQKQRPEVMALQETQGAFANIRRAQEASMNPSLGVSVQHQRNLDTAGSGRQGQTFGTLQLSIPVFDSGLTRARVKQARQDEEQIRINLEQLKLGISQEVREALRNLEGARARLENAEAQVRLAEEVYRLAIVRQGAGAGVYVEVIDALTALTAARNQLVTARYDYLTSFAQLQRAVGSDDLATTPATGGGSK